MSGYSPWWRRWLQRHARWLFRVCGERNYHWRTDRVCHCFGHAVSLAVPGALTERSHLLGSTRRDRLRCRREGHVPSPTNAVGLSSGRYVPLCERCGYGVEPSEAQR